MKERAGKLKQNLSGDLAYFSFLPNKLPPVPQIIVDEEMQKLLIDAHSNLNVLNELSKRIPNIDLFIAMYVRKEALLSSQIEGTQCTLLDVLNPNIDTNISLDVLDVINYLKAIDYSIKRLNDLPLCNRLIKETHAILLDNVRGSDKTPGEFRKSQNWIGGSNSTIKNANYIPPNVEDMNICMSELEKFINEDSSLDQLIKIALIHYQFETIHPFLDGNGRIGRLLITLYLMSIKLLSSPVLYLSSFLKINRIEYYDRLSEVRNKGNYEQWIKFFLKGIIDTATDGINTIDLLTNLHNKNINKFNDLYSTTKKNVEMLFSYIESYPIIDTVNTAKKLNLSKNAISKYINILKEKNILKLSRKSGKASIYEYKEYIDILKKDTELN